MNFYYDLHIHSCLSPCGDMDMTPNNIVNMAKLLGLDVIALTDHNSSLNCEAIIKVAEKERLCVLPGMELTTSEEIHAVCLFDSLDKALKFSEYVSSHQMKIKNRTDIYGRQVIMDENDKEIGELDDLLILATDISISNAYELVKSFGGMCFPAHIDRESCSVLSVLGEIDKEFGFNTAEIFDLTKKDALKNAHPILNNMNIVSNSDAHYLGNMREAKNFFELDFLSAENVIKLLSNAVKL